MLRIAMIGGGPKSMIGPVHRAAIKQTNEFELVAGCFSSKISKQEIAELLSMPVDSVYQSWQELLNDQEKLKLDAVAILTPNNTHLEIALAFARAGINVVCEKPLDVKLDLVPELRDVLVKNKLSFVLTHPYSAYPVIRKARQDVLNNKIGTIRLVYVEYLQSWLSNLVENNLENHGAVWRTNPEVGGAGGVLGDIGTHAFQLLEYVSNLKVDQLSSILSSLGGRKVPDDAHMLLKMENGASGSLWCSQVAVGCMNGLRLRLFGDLGSISWWQEEPEVLHYFDQNDGEYIYRKGMSGEGKLPPGHPEGYIAGFTSVYADSAKQIKALRSGHKVEIESPGLEDGVRGMKFIQTVMKSARETSWTKLQ